MKQILPIGTIVEFQKCEFLIMGYRFGMVNDEFQIVYQALWYPLGFVEGKEPLALPSIEDVEIIYMPDGLNNQFTQVLQQFESTIADVGAERAVEIIHEFAREHDYGQEAAE